MGYIFVFGLMAPTLFLATFFKEKANKQKVIRSLNSMYLIISIAFIFRLICFEINKEASDGVYTMYDGSFIITFWMIFLLSRCSEIMYSFVRDAYDKVLGKKSKDRVNFGYLICLYSVVVKKNISDEASEKILHVLLCPLVFKNYCLKKLFSRFYVSGKDIRNSDRLILSFKSYFELIINFSILYYLLPATSWKGSADGLNIVQSLYFSGVTITTLGYGDISPANWFAQFLSVFEVLCGFSLIVVCFAIYLKDEKKTPGVTDVYITHAESCRDPLEINTFKASFKKYDR